MYYKYNSNPLYLIFIVAMLRRRVHARASIQFQMYAESLLQILYIYFYIHIHVRSPPPPLTAHRGHPSNRPHLFTRIFLQPLLANVAVHATAPLELAPALPLPIDLMSIVAAAAAQQIAALQAVGRAIAAPSDGAQRAGAQIALTIVGRCIQVDHFQALRPLHLAGIHDGRAAAPEWERKNGSD